MVRPSCLLESFTFKSLLTFTHASTFLLKKIFRYLIELDRKVLRKAKQNETKQKKIYITLNFIWKVKIDNDRARFGQNMMDFVFLSKPDHIMYCKSRI